MLLIDAHGNSIEAGICDLLLPIVINALLLGGLYRKMTATQSHVLNTNMKMLEASTFKCTKLFYKIRDRYT